MSGSIPSVRANIHPRTWFHLVTKLPLNHIPVIKHALLLVTFGGVNLHRLHAFISKKVTFFLRAHLKNELLNVANKRELTLLSCLQRKPVIYNIIRGRVVALKLEMQRMSICLSYTHHHVLDNFQKKIQ